MTVRKSTKKNKGGRPTDYKAIYDQQVYKLCLLGATDKEISNFFNTSERTLNTWKKQFPKFLHSIKRGKQIADSEVAEKLFKRATGYKFTETSFEKVDSKIIIDSTGDGDIIKDAYKKKVTVKELAPDPTAQIFWLKNRQPKSWRDKQEHELTGKNGGPIESTQTVVILPSNGHETKQ